MEFVGSVSPIPITYQLPRLPETECKLKGASVHEVYSAYLRHQAAVRAPSTYVNHDRARTLAAHLPSHPTPGDVAVWLTQLRSLGLREGTVYLYRCCLAAALSWGNNAGLCWGNPVAMLPYDKRLAKPLPKAIPRIARTWPRLAAVAADPRELGFLATLRFSGLRLGEALALQPADLDVRARVLSVRWQRSQHSLGPLKAPKYNSRREVPIRDELAPILRRVLGAGPAVAAVGRGGAERKETPYLFPYRVNDLEALRGRLAEVEPEHFGAGDAWHVFRHSFAVEAVGKGMPTEELSRWLGHQSVATTEKYLSTLTGRAARLGVFAKGHGRGGVQ